ncbi:MAG: restriction endonuclease [Acidobacteriaceae bacterium]|nr:restriction endonuclease [Acidobacteriaceae bacterium]
MVKQVLMVRAGRDSIFIDEFLSRQMVAIGWWQLGDLSDVRSRDQIRGLVERAWPDSNKFQNSSSVGQVYRFRSELVPGATTATYDSNRRVYHLGTVTGEYIYHPEYDPELVHTKAVKWEKEIARDVLSAAAKNSLGSISTIFRLSDEAAEELRGAGQKAIAIPVTESVEDEAEGETEVRRDTEQRALEFLQDRLSKLAWDEMQELVAGLLRAMGYKTRISPAGPDRGRDILASPDGFGFQPPRIVVEVKHRKNTMGAPEVRSFVGGLRQNDNGLYVSTGGFTREARYEADRTNQNLTLMDADDLGKAIVEHYDQMDAEARALLPLKKIYWPV